MLLSLFYRLLRLIITSIICSLPIYLGYFVSIQDKGILLLSFIAFVVATGIDTYYFSFTFWKIRDYYLGLLLPLVIYNVMGFLTCLVSRPIVFNRIFLPFIDEHRFLPGGNGRHKGFCAQLYRDGYLFI